jgi:hypothetical protein
MAFVFRHLYLALRSTPPPREAANVSRIDSGTFWVDVEGQGWVLLWAMEERMLLGLADQKPHPSNVE